MAKRQYNTWSQDDMKEAIEKFNNGDLKFNEACRVYSIPKPTFRRHLRGLNSHQRIGHPKDLTAEMEAELVRHVLELESRFFGLTITDLRRLAFQLAEKYKLPHRFNKEKQLAGWKWYYQFMKNHPEISLRTPESTSMARCKGFNKKVVMEFFDQYEAIIDKEKFTASQIYNVDETGLSTVHKPAKILAQKGKHQVGAVTSGERGTNTTCICCMNAAGEFVPPMLIFKRKRMTDDLKRGGPPNTLYSCSESGWIVASLFVEWLQHFIRCLKLEKSEKKQILLILDGHSTHTKNLEAISLARNYGIVMLSLPAHTTHKLQPLDKSFFKSLKHHFNEVSAAWMRNHAGSTIKQANISEILGTAYPRAVCMETAMHGFEFCGLWPCNRHKIREEDYVVLDKDDTTCPPVEKTPPREIQAQGSQTLTPPSLPSTTSASSDMNINGKETHPNVLSIRAEIENISPKLQISTCPNKISQRTTRTQVLTESPYKNELEQKLNEAKKKSTAKNLTAKKTLKKKNIECKTNNEVNKKKKIKKTESWFCKLCSENREEGMIQCTQCDTWVHELCAGTDQNTIHYLCDDCEL